MVRYIVLHYNGTKRPHILNRNGPRTEPCGTPQQMLKLPVLKLTGDTENVLPIRWEESQLMTWIG